MTAQELLTALLGSLGCLVLSLLLNYLFYRGAILNPKKTVPREDYDTQVNIVDRNTKALEVIAAEDRVDVRSSRKKANDGR